MEATAVAGTVAVNPAGPSPFRTVPLDAIRESTTNPRRHFDEKGMGDLVASVKESGILTPLLLRPKANGKGSGFEIVAGHRRYRAAKKAGLDEVPAIVRELSDDQALELQTIENLQREDVHPLDEALGFQALLKRPGHDVESIAAKLGKSTSHVYQRLKLVELIPAAQKLFFGGEITAGHAILIARLQPKDQQQVLQAMRSGRGASVRDLARWIDENIHLDLNAAPWPKADALLVEAAGACTTCPKRTGANQLLFPDIAKKDTCTDRGCFHAKTEAFIARKKAELGDGKKVLELSAEYYTQEKGVLTAQDYVVTKAEACAHVTKGIVVEGRKNLGQVLSVCVEDKCKTHRPYGSTGYRPSARDVAERKRKAQRMKTEGRYRMKLYNKVVEAVPAMLRRKDLELVALRFWMRTEANDQSRLCAHLGWEIRKGTYSREFDRTGREEIPKLSDHDLSRFFVRLVMIRDVSVNEWDTGGPRMLLAAARHFKINPEAVKKSVAAEDRAAAKAKAVKRAATKKPAPAKRGKAAGRAQATA